MRLGKNWLCNAIKPGRYDLVKRLRDSKVFLYIEAYEPYVEWFGGKLAVAHKQIIWNEWSGRFNFIISWRKGFLFRTWIRPPGMEVIVRLGV